MDTENQPKEKHHYFEGHVSKSFMSLYAGRVLMLIGSGLVGLFLPIFLYELFGDNMLYVALFYGISALLYLVLLPIGVPLVDERIGLQRALRLSTIFSALFFVMMYLVEPETIWIYIPASIIILTCFRLTFWVPYKVDLGLFTDHANRGRQMSLISATRMFVAVVLPLLSAFIIERFGFDTLFVIAIVLYLATVIPWFHLPGTHEDYAWTAKHTWGVFIHNLKKRRSIWAFVAQGAETSVGLMIWPVFIFLLVNGDFFQVGFLSTLIVLVTIVLQLFTGKIIDTKMDSKKLLHISSILYAVGWIFKMMIVTAFHIFIAGAYHSIMQIFTRTPFNAITYDMSSAEGDYIDEYTVIMEMATNLGRVIILGLAAFLLWIGLGITWIFIIAAVASIAFMLLSSKDMHLKKDVERDMKICLDDYK